MLVAGPLPQERWLEIEAHERKLLEQVKPQDRILDAGCGCGRLLQLLPRWYTGLYLGVDASADMVEVARERNPFNCFRVADLAHLPLLDGEFDLALCFSVRGLVVAARGRSAWRPMRMELRRVAKRILYSECTDA